MGPGEVKKQLRTSVLFSVSSLPSSASPSTIVVLSTMESSEQILPELGHQLALMTS